MLYLVKNKKKMKVPMPNFELVILFRFKKTLKFFKLFEIKKFNKKRKMTVHFKFWHWNLFTFLIVAKMNLVLGVKLSMFKSPHLVFFHRYRQNHFTFFHRYLIMGVKSVGQENI